MPGKIRISLDAMGGDHGLAVVVPGAAVSLARHPDSEFIFFGDEALIDRGVERDQIDFLIRRRAARPEPQEEDGQHRRTKCSTVRNECTSGYPIVALVGLASTPYLSSSF